MPAHMSMVFSNKTQNWAHQQRNARAQLEVVAPQKRQGGFSMNLDDLRHVKKGCKSCSGK